MRIVSHSCSNTEIICALGCADYLVGVDDHSDYPADIVDNLPKVGPDLDVDPDKVIALKPDLIIASDTVPGHDQVISRLSDCDIPILVRAPRCLQDIAADFIKIAQVLGVPERGHQLADQFLEQLDSLTASRLEQPQKVLVEWWPKPVIVPGRQSWATSLIQLAGGINPLADDDCQSRPISTEEAQQFNPDVIVMSWCGVPERNYRPNIVSRREGWEDISAVRNHRIVAISEAFLGRPGPRLVTGLKKLCAAVTGQPYREPA